MLYQGAARFVSAGIEAIERNDIKTAHESLLRAQDIINELAESLDFDRGGDIARNLASLYEFFNRQLIDANLREDAKPARDVLSLLRELLPAWQTAVRQAAPAASPLAGAPR